VRIDADGAGEALVEFLARRYRHTSPEGWRARIVAGEVSVGGVAAAPELRLAAGDNVVWARPPWEEPEVPLRFTVLLEDEDLLAVNKPSGLPTLPAGGFLEHTLLAIVRQRRRDAAPVHRLGRATSGVVLFACSDRARSGLSEALRDRRVHKRYRALASGRVPGPFTVDAPIGPVPHAVLGTVHGASATGRVASSHVTVVEVRQDTTLVDVVIDTGRPHQIRIHLAAAGFPLAGDPLYGPGGVPLPGTRALPGDGGYLLHAHELRFAHPSSSAEVAVIAPPPTALDRTP
jgi:23S rRNA pseudouridine1911/1915/1917 synthase